MIKKTNLLIIVLGILLAGCFEPDVAPPLEFNGTANMTIAEFQKFHTLSPDNPATLIDTNAIITGLVISTDQFGSCYKEIYFQDETGGLCIRTSNTSYYTKYRIGQRIFVKAKDLYLGNYVSGNRYGFYQIGLFDKKVMKDLSANAENLHVFRSGIPEALPDLKKIKTASELSDNDYHTYITLVNCYFTEALVAGTRYYEERLLLGGAANQPIKFNLGSSTDQVIARISAYCTFADSILPAGALNISGILTKFGDDHQLIIQRIEDVQIIPDEKVLLSFDMTTNPFENGWSNHQEKGTNEWIYYSGANVRVQPTSGVENECWFVSPKLNFAGEKDVAIAFTYRLTTGTNENLQLCFTTNAGATWTQLTDFKAQAGGSTDVVLHLQENIATNPNLQIAFQYKTTDIYPICSISKVVFKANVGM